MPNQVMADALAVARAIIENGAEPRVVGDLPETWVDQFGVTRVIPRPSQPKKTGGGPMSQWKIICNFRGVRGEYWQETHNLEGPTTVASVETLVTDGLFVEKRLALLSPLYTWASIRVNTVDAQRKGKTILISRIGTAVGGDGVGADVAGTALKLQYSALDGQTRYGWMRGFNDDTIQLQTTGGAVIYKDGTKEAVQLWLNQLKLKGCGWLRRKPRTLGTPKTLPLEIASINGALAPGYASITPRGGGPWGAGDRVTISMTDAKIFPGLNGQWTVLGTEGLTFLIRYQVAGNANHQFAHGKVRGIVADDFLQYVSYKVAAVEAKKTRNGFSHTRRGLSAQALKILA